MELRDINGNEFRTAFYYDVRAEDPSLRYLVFVLRTGQEISFKSFYPTRNCLSPEQQARRLIPLYDARQASSEFPELSDLFENDEFLEWEKKKVEKHFITH